MSALVFRASTPEDAAAIQALCRELLCGGQPSPMFEPALLHWKYWGRWPGWDGARSYVIERDGQLLAHIAAVPVSVSHAEGRWTLLHPLDWAARPELVGVGAMLLTRLAKVADGILVVGGSSSTQRMLGPLGYRKLPDVVRYAAQPLSELPAQLELGPLGAGLEPPGLAAVFAPQWVPERSSALREHWHGCPALPGQSWQLQAAGGAQAGFSLGFAPVQARLIDLWHTAPGPEGWAQAALAARHAAARAGVPELVSLANTSLERQALLAAGFVERGSIPVHISAPRAPQLASAGLRFQMLDGDAAYLHRGLPESWLG